MAEPDEPQKPTVDEPTSESVGEDDPITDQVVNDIIRKEADDELKIQDEALGRAVVMKLGLWERFKNAQVAWWRNPRKRWTTISVVVVIIAAVFAVPLTRYEILGLLMHEKVTVDVVDNKTGEAVSGAQVEVGGAKAKTDGEGVAILYPRAGSKNLQVSKSYYASSGQRILITLSAARNVFRATVRALGRQVKVKVVNTITNEPIEGLTVAASGATAKTDKSGMTTVVLPSSVPAESATFSLSGYNTSTLNITASSSLAQNTFHVTPSGRVYFLSNASGTIDVVSTNLDGSDRQTILAGTGAENPNGTELIPSPDWRYLVLLAQRSGSTAELYLINTTDNDQLTTIDSANATFSPVGWSGDNFVYRVSRNDVAVWQSYQQQLKSLNAVSGQTILLDQTQAVGMNASNFTAQYFGSEYILNSQVVYAKSWTPTVGTISSTPAKQIELDSIGADGSNHKVVKAFSFSTDPVPYPSISVSPGGPDQLLVNFYENSDNNYYLYENGAMSADSSITQGNFYQNTSIVYLPSPSDDQFFWAEQRDGESVLLTGDASGGSQKQIAALSNYTPFGWFTENYVLVSQNSRALYIMPATGGTPLKIASYYASGGN